MKKLLVIGTLALGSLTFAATTQTPQQLPAPAGQNFRQNMQNNNMRNAGNIGKNNRIGGQRFLTPEQQAQAKKDQIAIQERQLEINKQMILTTPDWKKIEKLNGEIANLHAKRRTESMKARFNANQALVKTN